eukprot:jgi/Bigna1/79879/fgenesh1_pg.66_\
MVQTRTKRKRDDVVSENGLPKGGNGLAFRQRKGRAKKSRLLKSSHSIIDLTSDDGNVIKAGGGCSVDNVDLRNGSLEVSACKSLASEDQEVETKEPESRGKKKANRKKQLTRKQSSASEDQEVETKEPESRGKKKANRKKQLTREQIERAIKLRLLKALYHQKFHKEWKVVLEALRAKPGRISVENFPSDLEVGDTIESTIKRILLHEDPVSPDKYPTMLRDGAGLFETYLFSIGRQNGTRKGTYRILTSMVEEFKERGIEWERKHEIIIKGDKYCGDFMGSNAYRTGCRAVYSDDFGCYKGIDTLLKHKLVEEKRGSKTACRLFRVTEKGLKFCQMMHTLHGLPVIDVERYAQSTLKDWPAYHPLCDCGKPCALRKQKEGQLYFCCQTEDCSKWQSPLYNNQNSHKHKANFGGIKCSCGMKAQRIFFKDKKLYHYTCGNTPWKKNCLPRPADVIDRRINKKITEGKILNPEDYVYNEGDGLSSSASPARASSVRLPSSDEEKRSNLPSGRPRMSSSSGRAGRRPLRQEPPLQQLGSVSSRPSLESSLFSCLCSYRTPALLVFSENSYYKCARQSCKFFCLAHNAKLFREHVPPLISTDRRDPEEDELQAMESMLGKNRQQYKQPDRFDRNRDQTKSTTTILEYESKTYSCLCSPFQPAMLVLTKNKNRMYRCWKVKSQGSCDLYCYEENARWTTSRLIPHSISSRTGEFGGGLTPAPNPKGFSVPQTRPSTIASAPQPQRRGNVCDVNRSKAYERLRCKRDMFASLYEIPANQVFEIEPIIDRWPTNSRVRATKDDYIDDVGSSVNIDGGGGDGLHLITLVPYGALNPVLGFCSKILPPMKAGVSIMFLTPIKGTHFTLMPILANAHHIHI